MRVKVTKSKSSKSFYIIKDVNVDGKRTTKIVAALGNEMQLRKEDPDYEPLAWAKKQARLLTQQEKAKRNNPDDPNRFIKEKHFTKEGEKASQVQYLIDQERINKEKTFDGFYGICTDLEASPLELIKINKNRWEIERCFREMKTEFQARPVYVRRADRIKSHFLVCFLALLVFRLFKQAIPGHSSYELVKTLRQFNLAEISTGDYISIFKRTDLTDKIHESFGFRLDRELITQKYFKKIYKQTKKEKKYAKI